MDFRAWGFGCLGYQTCRRGWAKGLGFRAYRGKLLRYTTLASSTCGASSIAFMVLLVIVVMGFRVQAQGLRMWASVLGYGVHDKAM